MKKTIRSLAAILAIGFAIIPGAPAAGEWPIVTPLPPVQTDWIGPLNIPAESRIVLEHDEKGTYLAVWLQKMPVGSDMVPALVVSRSTDAAENWSTPVPLWPVTPSSPAFLPTSLVAAQDGTWIVTFTQERLQFMAITRNSGITWEPPINMSDKFPPESSDATADRVFTVINAGDGQWLFGMSVPDRVTDPFYIIRSTDNAVTFGTPVWFGDRIGHFEAFNSPDSEEFLIYYVVSGGSETSTHFSRFVYDNGTRFGPVMPGYVGGTDGQGNWLLLKWRQDTSDIPNALYSTDSGVTLTPIPAPPQLESSVTIHKISYSSGGMIMVLGLPWAHWTAGVYLPTRAAVTRTTDNGNSWTAWEQLREGYHFGDNDMPLESSDSNEFVTLFLSLYYSYPRPVINELYRFKGDPPQNATARDWQLFE